MKKLLLTTAAISALALSGCKTMTLDQKMQPKQAGQQENYFFQTHPHRYFDSLLENKDNIELTTERAPDLITGSMLANTNIALRDSLAVDVIFNMLRTTDSQLANPWVNFSKKVPLNHAQALQLANKQVPIMFKGYGCKIDNVYDGDYSIATTFNATDLGSFRRYRCNDQTQRIVVLVHSKMISSNETNLSVSAVTTEPSKKFTFADNAKFELFNTIKNNVDNSWLKVGLGFKEVDSDHKFLALIEGNGKQTFTEVPAPPNTNHNSKLTVAKKEHLH